ncbi:hypothetical protein ACT17_06150 [Mycolicibacterium conceptionense]|uniref:Uncharacterized protein n=1 Tax=Mycolicibacterium conceptionense TaxID=451644 RepID=A0A0J8UFB9_9MYCO|nr:hypothetical protein [Mycolicibacterium conceptionense]KMV19622.1 hypothetical protein ACT17_06150 [Mycolicibacterium conceptionense]
MTADELLGISPGGEYFVTRDEYGVLRRHDLFTPGEPIEISVTVFDRMVTDVGLIVPDAGAGNGKALDEQVREHLPRVPFDFDAELSLELIESAPRVLLRWLDDARRRALLPEVIQRMLRRPEVSGSPDTVRALTRILEQAGGSPADDQCGVPEEGL